MDSGQSIGVIDISALAGAPDGGNDPLDRRIAEALTAEGAFLAVGVPAIAAMAARARELPAFFALPDEVKAPLAIRKRRAASRNLYRGFTPLPDAPEWSYNEIFDIGPEPPNRDLDLEGAEAFREANVWPPEALLPGWRAAMLTYSADCRQLARSLMAAALRGLGCDPADALMLSRGGNGTLRLLHYAQVPAGYAIRTENGDLLPAVGGERRVMARQHIDTGLLSIICQDEVGGLEFKGPDGRWRTPPGSEEGLSVHCGDLLAGLSDGALAATPHRVMGVGEERCSIGYFLEPDFTSLIQPPDGGQTKSYAAHLMESFPGRFDPPSGKERA